MIKALANGIAALVVVYGAWFGALESHTYSRSLLVLLWAGPALASFVVAWTAPRSKFALGLSMAVLAAVLAAALNAVYEHLGNAVDFPGVSGALSVFAMTILPGAVVAGLGALAGQWAARRFSK
jgi:hypothetical protein